MTEGVRFGVLGPLEMRVHGDVVPLGTPKQRAVLAALIINPNRAVRFEALIDAIWEQRPPEGARSTLHNYVSTLRRIIGGTGADPHQILARAPAGYQLNVAETQWDLGCFRADASSGLTAAAAGQFEQAGNHLRAALAMWRGPVLDDLCGFSFVDSFATVVGEEKLLAHAALAEAEIALGRARAIIGSLEALAAEHPYHEPLWAQLITAYYLAERQSDALDAYHRLKDALARDLGIDPGPTVRAVFNRVLHQIPLETEKAAQLISQHTILEKESDASTVAARLRVAAGRTYPLTGSSTGIGRSSDNDVVLPDLKVSRHHAVIVKTVSAFAITDLQSANGVFVAGQRINGSTDLEVGDMIRIGSHEFTFEIQ